MTDYSDARFWAISGIGYGKGFTPAEARDNYVKSQLRNYDAKTTIFKTKAKWEAALRDGDAKATLFEAPEGVDGFVLDGQVRWTIDGKIVSTATGDQIVKLHPCGCAADTVTSVLSENREQCSSCGAVFESVDAD